MEVVRNSVEKFEIFSQTVDLETPCESAQPKWLSRSCSGRDRFGPFHLSDCSWLTPHPVNPLTEGQYANNCSNDKKLLDCTYKVGHIFQKCYLLSTEKAANVYYQEFDVLVGFPVELCQYLPSVNYRPDVQRHICFCAVVLVSLRDINVGEELFSNYYTIVHLTLLWYSVIFDRKTFFKCNRNGFLYMSSTRLGDFYSI
ncbi:SET domain-containing protein 9-like [Myxocyprinus asiaticus]|uniref:SET domain-containing protein 9-like n=1 Tax=Myxocyprinus asiaticus TaxID=70543 RepID=UPI0022226892|nr:SET domain-containing protein 9-like [Myxocyprinus asiaticus]